MAQAAPTFPAPPEHAYEARGGRLRGPAPARRGAAFPATLSQAAEALVSGARIDAGARQRKVVLDGIVGRIESEGFGDTKGGTQVDAGRGRAGRGLRMACARVDAGAGPL